MCDTKFCPGADGDQQGLLGVAKFLVVDGFNLCQGLVNLAHNFVVNGTAILIVFGAGFGGDGEALGHRHTQAGHFRQVRALAAKQLPHGAVALGEQVDILMRHSIFPFRFSGGHSHLCEVHLHN